MSATEDDTELRDLLIQNLENNGVLNKLKAEVRAAVFLALEEQDRLQNKTPLVNDNLTKCLNTKDGRLVAGLIVDFLQVFHLDFSLAVFQPEIHTQLSGLDGRQLLCRELGLPEAELHTNSPLLLELVRRGRHRVTAITEAEVVSDANRNPPPPVNRVSAGEEEDKPQECRPLKEAADSKALSSAPDQCLDVDVNVEDPQDEDDSFFDDPLPKPQKTYGWQADAGGSRKPSEVSQSKAEQTPEGEGSTSERTSHSREEGFRDQKVRSKADEGGSLHLEDDVEYDDDDFNSHRSDHYRSELSISEDIEEVSIEGPDISDKQEDTADLSISQMSQSHGVDYMEEVA